VGLEFVEFKGKHSGQNIEDELKEVICNYGLEGKIIGIVADNAKANDVAIGGMASFLELDSHTFPRPEELHFRCFGHVMNLGCKGELSLNFIMLLHINVCLCYCYAFV
jgi:hypothetical protein